MTPAARLAASIELLMSPMKLEPYELVVRESTGGPGPVV